MEIILAEPIKGSMHIGRGSAKHNPHEFLGDDKDVVNQNYIAPGNDDFYGTELEFYEDNFGEQFTEQNKKHETARNYKRIKSIEEYYKSKQYQPSEMILQIGNCRNDRLPTKEEFLLVVNSYILTLQEYAERTGNHLVLLNSSCHFDETVPHCQLRYLWKTSDNRLLQEDAMKEAGLEVPDPEKLAKDLEEAEKLKTYEQYDKKSKEYKEGKKKYENAVKGAHRYNNRAMTFTAEQRAIWYDTCDSYGFIIDREPIKDKNGHGKKHSTTRKYIYQQEAEARRRKHDQDQREIAILKKDIEQLNVDIKHIKREQDIEAYSSVLGIWADELLKKEIDIQQRIQELSRDIELVAEQGRNNTKQAGELQAWADNLNTRDADISARETSCNKKEQELKEREKKVKTGEEQLTRKQEVYDQYVKVKDGEIDAKELALLAREEALDTKERELYAKVPKIENIAEKQAEYEASGDELRTLCENEKAIIKQQNEYLEKLKSYYDGNNGTGGGHKPQQDKKEQALKRREAEDERKIAEVIRRGKQLTEAVEELGLGSKGSDDGDGYGF